MTETIITYVLFLFAAGSLTFQYYQQKKSKETGMSVTRRPLQTIASVIVLLVALYAIITGQTYEDILSFF